MSDEAFDEGLLEEASSEGSLLGLPGWHVDGSANETGDEVDVNDAVERE
jgi:hypothetical protein